MERGNNIATLSPGEDRNFHINIYIYTHTHIHTHIYILAHICIHIAYIDRFSLVIMAIMACEKEPLFHMIK